MKWTPGKYYVLRSLGTGFKFGLTPLNHVRFMLCHNPTRTATCFQKAASVETSSATAALDWQDYPKAELVKREYL